MLIAVPFVVALVSCSPSFIIGTNFIVLVGSMFLITAKACGEFMLVVVLKLPASLGTGYGSYCRNNRKGGVVKQGDALFCAHGGKDSASSPYYDWAAAGATTRT